MAVGAAFVVEEGLLVVVVFVAVVVKDVGVAATVAVAEAWVGLVDK